MQLRSNGNHALGRVISQSIDFYSGSIIQNFYHINILKRNSNLGLSMSHRLNYEGAALTTQPLRLDYFFENPQSWFPLSKSRAT